MRYKVPETIPQRDLSHASPFGKWMSSGPAVGDHHPSGENHPWHRVLWLSGVDYFSTLGYQPGIALLAAGALSPIATAILVLVTLLGALPVYCQVASRSYAGQGSIAMLENLLSGWKSKLLVLVLLGFAATDFVITMTMSASDAAQHAIHNPLLHDFLGDHQILLTLGLLALLTTIFLRGFADAIGVAAVAAIPYLALSLVVLIRGLWEIAVHPEHFANWRNALTAGGDMNGLLLAALLVFPKLALGLSGFETGVSVMPLVDGGSDDSQPPLGRIRNTRKLLAAAAGIMSVMLMLSSFVTAVLIAPEDYKEGGKAAGRAIAFLGHKYLGGLFGSIYDISTIVILGLAGASAMAGLLHLIPRYLPRFGMAPAWLRLTRPLVVVLFAISVVVTLAFRADVEAQGAAYATGVLVLILSAAFAATLALWREKRPVLSLFCGLVTLVFAYTLVDNCLGRPDGLIIGSAFIVLTLVVSGISRSVRSTEMRVEALYLKGARSVRLSPELVGKKVHMVPVRQLTPESLARKKAEILGHYKVTGPFAFIHVRLADNRSEFKSELVVDVDRQGDDYVAVVSGAVAVANTIAFLSEMIDPISIFLGLTRANLMEQAFRYLLFGEGETGLMVYMILLRYWEWTKEEDVRPVIYLMSD